MITKL
jgi:hypothetical protein